MAAEKKLDKSGAEGSSEDLSVMSGEAMDARESQGLVNQPQAEVTSTLARRRRLTQAAGGQSHT